MSNPIHELAIANPWFAQTPILTADRVSLIGCYDPLEASVDDAICERASALIRQMPYLPACLADSGHDIIHFAKMFDVSVGWIAPGSHRVKREARYLRSNGWVRHPRRFNETGKSMHSLVLGAKVLIDLTPETPMCYNIDTDEACDDLCVEDLKRMGADDLLNLPRPLQILALGYRMHV